MHRIAHTLSSAIYLDLYMSSVAVAARDVSCAHRNGRNTAGMYSNMSEMDLQYCTCYPTSGKWNCLVAYGVGMWCFRNNNS